MSRIYNATEDNSQFKQFGNKMKDIPKIVAKTEDIPQMTKQMTNGTIITESATYGMGTPVANGTQTQTQTQIIHLQSPIRANTPTQTTLTQTTQTTQTAHSVSPKFAMQKAAQAVANEIENEIKYAAKRELFSGKAQYQTELDLNDNFLAMAKSYGFMRGDDSRQSNENSNELELDVDMIGWNGNEEKSKSKRKSKKSKLKSKRLEQTQRVTLRDVIAAHAPDAPNDEFDNEYDSDL